LILTSACLCGVNCKYNGLNNLHPRFLELLEQNQVLPVCPEQLGGLCTPRYPSEILKGSGIDVLEGRSPVITSTGRDVTEQFIRGAKETLNIARLAKIKLAVLKSHSPSCGVGQIYDGTFTSSLTSGDGVTAALLKKHNIRVISDLDFVRR
jgi:uncharacterized protein YbbK (DUF523 family)